MSQHAERLPATERELLLEIRLTLTQHQKDTAIYQEGTGKRFERLAEKVDDLRRSIDGDEGQDGLRTQLALMSQRLVSAEADIAEIRGDRKRLLGWVLGAVGTAAIGAILTALRMGAG